MKNKLIPFYDRMMLRKRYIIETINDMLKNTAQIVHSRHRSVSYFIMNLISALGHIASSTISQRHCRDTASKTPSNRHCSKGKSTHFIPLLQLTPKGVGKRNIHTAFSEEDVLLFRTEVTQGKGRAAWSARPLSSPFPPSSLGVPAPQSCLLVWK